MTIMHNDETWAALPYRWLADTETPRRIRVRIKTWQGLSAGAKHWLASVGFEGNAKVLTLELACKWAR